MAGEWQDTGIEAGAEVEAAKATALAAFMAAPVDSPIGSPPAVLPQISRTVWTQTTKLSADDVAKLKKVVNAAIMDATLKHIGPVSTDESVLIDIHEVDGIKKLNLRSTAISWEHVTVNPAVAGLNRAIFKIVWQDSTDIIPLPLALWVHVSGDDHAWEKIWPIDIPQPPLKSVLLPLPDGEAALGNEGKWADGQHVHPLVRPSKIRYYLSDTHGTGDWTGHLLLTSNPYDEAHAIDYENANEWATFVSDLGSPGLAVWPGGAVHAHIRLKLINPQVGRTYRLYMGNGDIVYTAMIWDWTHSDTYQIKESAPAEPTVTTSYATVDLDIPVAALTSSADRRLGLNVRLRVFVGGDEATFSGEKVVIRIGGDNASYLDTLFTPDGGFSGVHNDLDGREAANAHPMSAITPGRIQTPSNAIITTSSGLFAMPSNSNFAIIDGTEDLLGVSAENWLIGNPCIEFMVMSARKILKAQTVPDGYYAFAWGYTDTGYQAEYDVQDAYRYSVWRFRLIGGVWRLCSSMNM